MSYEDEFRELKDIFQRGMPNPKLEERRALLTEHPELRLRINLDPLRLIIDFAAFKCMPGSSILEPFCASLMAQFSGSRATANDRPNASFPAAPMTWSAAMLGTGSCAKWI